MTFPHCDRPIRLDFHCALRWSTINFRTHALSNFNVKSLLSCAKFALTDKTSSTQYALTIERKRLSTRRRLYLLNPRRRWGKDGSAVYTVCWQEMRRSAT